MVTEYFNAPIIMSLCALILAISFPLIVLVDFIRSVVSNHTANEATNDLIRSGRLTFVQAVVKNADYSDCSSSALLDHVQAFKAIYVDFAAAFTPSPLLHAPLSCTDAARTPFFLPLYQFFRSVTTLVIAEHEELQQDVDYWEEWDDYRLELSTYEGGPIFNIILRVDSPSDEESQDIEKFLNYFTREDFKEDTGNRDGDVLLIFDRIYQEQKWLLEERKMSLKVGTISWSDMKVIIERVMMTRDEWLEGWVPPSFTPEAAHQDYYGAVDLPEEELHHAEYSFEEREMEELIDQESIYNNFSIYQEFDFTFVNSTNAEVSQIDSPRSTIYHCELPSDSDSNSSSSADESLFSESTSSSSAVSNNDESSTSVSPSTKSEQPSFLPYIPSSKSAREGLIMMILKGYLGNMGATQEYPLDFISFSEETGIEFIRSFWAGRVV